MGIYIILLKEECAFNVLLALIGDPAPPHFATVNQVHVVG
jgi:hypothetical protein